VHLKRIRPAKKAARKQRGVHRRGGPQLKCCRKKKENDPLRPVVAHRKGKGNRGCRYSLFTAASSRSIEKVSKRKWCKRRDFRSQFAFKEFDEEKLRWLVVSEYGVY